jgi:hypothetical protein
MTECQIKTCDNEANTKEYIANMDGDIHGEYWVCESCLDGMELVSVD